MKISNDFQIVFVLVVVIAAPVVKELCDFTVNKKELLTFEKELPRFP